MNISSFYRLLHLFNTFLQIGKTFFTGEPYYIHKFSEVTKKIHQGKEDQKIKNRKKYFIIGAVILFFGALAGLGVTGASEPHGSWNRGFDHGFRPDGPIKELELFIADGKVIRSVEEAVGVVHLEKSPFVAEG